MTADDTRAVDMAVVRQLVDRAVRAATAPGGMVERRARPESEYTWSEPAPRPGFDAAQLVIAGAERMRARYAIGMRGEGASWADIADLMCIEWSEECRRVERAFELVAGQPSDRFVGAYVFWTCGGPLGCGRRVTDRGPYETWPEDNETGHADLCPRLAAETAARRQELAEQERRDAVREAAYARITDQFGRETVQRAWRVQARGGQYGAWSTGETLAVALVLGDRERLLSEGYSTPEGALRRILGGMDDAAQPSDPAEWLATLREAATGVAEGSRS